jgi:CRISPR-associated protein Cas5t
MIGLKIEVPICCLRQSWAREYAETYTVPPPSTVYGMLLSSVGETNRHQHKGVKLAIAMLSVPQKSTVIRTFRRFKKKELTAPENSKPDYQELLTDVQFGVWVDSSEEYRDNKPRLSERLRTAISNPDSVSRFGGLSLGESRDLVNSVSEFLATDFDKNFKWLVQSEEGLTTLPYWVDHVGSQGTKWQRYRLEPAPKLSIPLAAWTTIKST